MNCKIVKNKTMDGERFGLIADNLEVLTEFKYLSIKKVGPYCFMKRDDGKLDVFTEWQVIETDYTILELIPFDSGKLCIGHADNKVDIVTFRKVFNEVKTVILNETILGSTKMSDIRVCPEYVELYQNTENGLLKGYLYHPILGDFMPKYCEMFAKKIEVGKPYYPKEYVHSSQKCEWSQDCVYAIVTALINGQKKQGIITRIRKYIWSGYYKYDWKEVIPCIHDCIVNESAFRFKLVDYIAGERKESIFETCPYYELCTEGLLIRGYPHLKANYTLPLADSYKDILSYRNSHFRKEIVRFYDSTEQQKHILYRTVSPSIVQGSFDYMMKPALVSLRISKIVDGANEEPEIVWATEDLNIFKVKSNDGVELVFDKFDKNGKELRCEIGKGDVKICYVCRGYALLTVSTAGGMKKIVFLRPLKGDWLARTYELVETKLYNDIKEKQSQESIAFLGIRQDDRLDVYSNEAVLIAEAVETFDYVDGFFISTKKVTDKREYCIYLFGKLLYKCQSEEKFEFHYDGKEKLLFIRLGDYLIILNLQGKIIFERNCKDLKINLKTITCSNDAGMAIFKYNQEGKITPLVDCCFASVEHVANDTRVIASYKKDDYATVFGVLETTDGNICIDFEYDHISWENEIFICEKNRKKIYFDVDGWSIDEQKSATQKGSSKVILPVDKK